MCKEQLRTKTCGRKALCDSGPSGCEGDCRVKKYPTCCYLGLPVIDSNMAAERKKDNRLVQLFLSVLRYNSLVTS